MMSRLRGIVQHNLPVKLLALAVAIVLWLYVMNDQNPGMEGSYTVPVTVEHAPDGYQLSTDSETVTIRVRGPRSFLLLQGVVISTHGSIFPTLRRGNAPTLWRHPFHTVSSL